MVFTMQFFKVVGARSLGMFEEKKQKAKIQLQDINIYGEGFVSKRRLFDLPECRDCIYKGSSYCWSKCPYNVWRRDGDH
jgi:hypothetical protein